MILDCFVFIFSLYVSDVKYCIYGYVPEVNRLMLTSIQILSLQMRRFCIGLLKDATLSAISVTFDN